MLKLRRGVVISSDPLIVEVDGEERPAWADRSLVGEAAEGDEVIVNTEALDLGLGSGGFDVVHVNLTRGLGGGGTGERAGDEAQLHVAPARGRAGRGASRGGGAARMQLHRPCSSCRSTATWRPPCWAAAQASPGLRRRLRAERRRRASGRAVARRRRASRARAAGRARHRRARVRRRARGDQPGGGARRRRRRLGWEAIVCGPGPGILGSATVYGHGGLAALDSAHAALALGLPTLLSPRLSGADPRPRHRGLSHHTASVLELLLASVRIPVPEIELEGWPTGRRGAGRGSICRASSMLCTRSATTATTWRSSRWTSRPTRPAGFRRGRWGGRSPRTRCSSPLRSPRGAALAGAVRVRG